MDAPAPEVPPTPPSRSSLFELASIFLWLGATSFGGPAAHIALMENEFVRRRAWLSRETFLDLLGAVNLIPGPNSTEMAIHIGYLRRGMAGLLVAGACFILPAALIVLGIAVLYAQYGTLPQFTALMYGIKPVVIAVVLQALYGLAKSAVRGVFLGVCAVVNVGLCFLDVNEILLLLCTGFLVMIARSATARRPPAAGAAGVAVALSAAGASAAEAVSTAAMGIWPLFLSFLKIGSVLYGSGYVLLAFLRAEFVPMYLTETQLLDATAVGQFTPGPVFTTATFIGYLIGGTGGAIVATVGIFLPAFFFVGISGPLIPRLQKSPAARAFLDGVTVASLALMAVVTWQLGRAAVIDIPTIVLALTSAVLLVRFKVNATWLILGGAAIGAGLMAF